MTQPAQHATGDAPELTIDGAIATITLRRPGVANRLELADLDLMRGFVRDVNAMRGVLVLRIRALGKHFCAGFNIGSLADSGAGARFEGFVDELEAARPVTIAMINGGVYGGATDLALACDFRLGVPACQMFVPAARLGLLFYRGGLQRYVSRLGLNVAKKLLLGAATFDAQQMLECGFLDRVVDGEALQSEANLLSAELATMAPLALLGMKKHLNQIARGTLDAAQFARDVAQADASDDLREGSLAWQQKRRPVFTGN
ncbi:enoyl-CoA hydratase/isomerase family protein [Paraburkholderia sp. MMS20-SJTR3]|uniref:Enoyl-CoA hydratase/isomerase family protein n=1 Tax=Paraburkholderia sejongensis TaxID=2886946 RepID=A0ABS8K114_9BURK|nr:enoyl-CoA hydratase/isomerase family protein [Paraburkholderia sp. MMS20-SJTR3]MCC8395854.1 enoyl-CoA hydratase/isomerase family protein [Paraburkholderia sp. MMS20-SJTR3]